ncbi:hypothetical protein RCL1_000760 [Eukaryota sp. TZLM3-RCL]
MFVPPPPPTDFPPPPSGDFPPPPPPSFAAPPPPFNAPPPPPGLSVASDSIPPPPPPDTQVGPTPSTSSRLQGRKSREFSRFSSDSNVEIPRGFKAVVEAQQLVNLSFQAQLITLKVLKTSQEMARERNPEVRRSLKESRDQLIEEGLRTNSLFHPPP